MRMAPSSGSSANCPSSRGPMEAGAAPAPLPTEGVGKATCPSRHLLCASAPHTRPPLPGRLLGHGPRCSPPSPLALDSAVVPAGPRGGRTAGCRLPNAMGVSSAFTRLMSSRPLSAPRPPALETRGSTRPLPPPRRQGRLPDTSPGPCTYGLCPQAPPLASPAPGPRGMACPRAEVVGWREERCCGQCGCLSGFTLHSVVCSVCRAVRLLVLGLR